MSKGTIQPSTAGNIIPCLLTVSRRFFHSDDPMKIRLYILKMYRNRKNATIQSYRRGTIATQTRFARNKSVFSLCGGGLRSAERAKVSTKAFRQIKISSLIKIGKASSRWGSKGTIEASSIEEVNAESFVRFAAITFTARIVSAIRSFVGKKCSMSKWNFFVWERIEFAV